MKTQISLISREYRFKQSKKAQVIATFQKVQFSGQLIWVSPNNEKDGIFISARVALCMPQVELIQSDAGQEPSRLLPSDSG
jgi:hypothetical protein